MLPAGYALQRLAALRPELVERVYSRGVFPSLADALGGVSERAPVSVAELLLLGLVVLGVGALVRGIRALRAGCSAWRLAGGGALRLAAVAGVLYATYLLAWGFNHQRLPFAEAAGWTIGTPTADELVAVCEDLIDDVARLRPGLPEDADGVSRMPHDERELRRLARDAYAACGVVHPSLRAAPGATKRPFLSAVLSAWWISGVYAPWTGEAHVNAELPEPQLGFTTCHELAHSLGFAREDEANFLALLACSRSGDAALAYSGAHAAVRYVLGALALVDPQRAAGLAERLGDGFRRDDACIRAFWTRKRSIATDAARRVNDSYLKSQGQVAGTKSYGRVVDLLVAEHRERERAREAASALARPIRVALLGGCWTTGGDEIGERVLPKLLRDALAGRGFRVDVLDLSACDQTSALGLARLPELAAWGADVLVVELVQGDLDAGTNQERSAANLRAVAIAAHGADMRVLVLGMLHPNGSDRVERFYRELARELDVALAPDVLRGVGGVREALKKNLRHPNAEGSRRLADNVLPHLLSLLADVRRAREEAAAPRAATLAR